MALRFNNASDKLLRTASLLDVTQPYTIMALLRMVATPGGGAFLTLWISGNNLPFGDGSAQIEGFDITEDGNLRLESYTTPNGSYNANGRGTTNLSVGTWYWGCLRRNSTTSLTTHLITMAGVLTQENNNTDTISTRSHTREEFGSAWSTDSDPYDGRLAVIKAWNIALSNDELSNEGRRMRPFRVANLHQFTPFIGGAGDVSDLSGNGRTWTANGSLTVEKGPPVPW